MHRVRKISPRGLSRHLAGFRDVGIAFTLFSLLNLTLFLLISLHPPLLEGLWLSTDRPWGILTSASYGPDLKPQVPVPPHPRWF